MAKGTYLGEFEQVVLLASLRLGVKAYGMAILHEIQEQTGRSSSIGAVYTTLERLERKGFVSSRLDGETPVERRGRVRRYFTVEGAGLAALRESQEMFARMTKGMQPAWGIE